MRRTRLIWLCVLWFSVGLGATGGAIFTTTTYYFTGQCTDCSGTGTGQLVLQNYTRGNPINPVNFVSFTYTSNLINVTVNAADSPSVSGTIPANLPASASVSIFGPNANVFQSQSQGNWCAGNSCESDFGPTSTWSLAAAPPATPAAGAPAVNDAVLIGLAAALAAMGGMLLKTRSA